MPSTFWGRNREALGEETAMFSAGLGAANFTVVVHPFLVRGTGFRPCEPRQQPVSVFATLDARR
jgi:hypothetical protein